MSERPIPNEPDDLRRRSESQIASRRGRELTRLSPDQLHRLLYELEVHQIELVTQNEELRRSRQEVEIGLARYTELFDFAPIGYAMLGPDESVREINHVGAQLLAKHRYVLTGLRFSNLLSIHERAGFSAMLGRARSNGVRQSCEVQTISSGSAPCTRLAIHAVALPRADGAILLAFEDVTECRAKEEKLARAERDLRDAHRRKDEFLAVLSHELRNPLAPIRNSLFVLEHVPAGSEQAKSSLQIIDRQARHLTRLVDDLLDVTRITRGKIQLQKERVELGELVRRTLDDHRMSFEANGIRLEHSVEPGFFWLDADPARMVQILSNLLGNSEKFTPRGGRVVVSVRGQGSKVVMRVRDTGAGIELGELAHPDGLTHLFEPFVQMGAGADRARGGLGLGLAMVKGLIELHGGRVEISSAGSGQGTEVTIWLPLVDAPCELTSSQGVRESHGRRVLVIEDSADSSSSLRDVLELSGHDVRVASDGPSGIEVAREFAPEIVLCDIGLPGMDGYQVARAFRADSALRRAYLVALSGYAQPEDHQRAVEAGFDQRVAKPANLENLNRLLAKMPAGHAEVNESVGLRGLNGS